MPPEDAAKNPGIEEPSDTHPMQPATALDRWRQPAPPINRLPVEILSMIFKWLSRMDGIYVFRHSSCCSIDIMRVCKLWTDVALNTVALWQSIKVDTTADWLATALPRSKNMPLDVAVYDASRILPSMGPLLIKEAHRLRLLEVRYGMVNVADQLEDAIFAVDQLPCLETLLIENMGDEFAPLELFNFDNPDKFPALQVLELTSSFVSWDSAIFRQLRILRIYEAYVPEWDTVPLTIFLASLTTCQSLEELYFSFVHFIDFTDHDLHGTDFVVSLPRLRSFYWFWPNVWAYDSPTGVYQLLEHLHFPPSADVELVFEVSLDNGLHDEYENISYLKMIPINPACLPILRTATSARLCSSRNDVRAEWMEVFCSGSDDQGSLKLSFDDSSSNLTPLMPFPYPRNAQFSDFCTLFALAPLTSLAVDLGGLSHTALLHAFRTFPRLSTLELRAWADTDVDSAACAATLFAALVMDAGGPSAGDTSASVVLPALHTLRLEGVSGSTHLLCTLFGCLALRAKRGAALLSSLRVQVGCAKTRSLHAEDTEACDAIQAALQAVVKAPVVYEVDPAVSEQAEGARGQDYFKLPEHS